MANEAGLSEIQAQLQSVVYSKEGFAIYKATSTQAPYSFSAKGPVADDPKHLLDVNISLIGKFSTNNQYGPTFEFKSYVIREDQIYHFLLKVVGHIGSAAAKQIADQYGERLDEVMKNSPEELLSVRGIGKKKLQRIIESWKTKSHLFQLSRLLSPFGVTTNQVIRIHEHFGDEAHDILLQNPYALVEIRGVGFKIADDVARKIGISHEAPERMIACAEYTMLEDTNGHTVFTPEDLIKRMQDVLKVEEHEEVSDTLCATGISQLIESKRCRFVDDIEGEAAEGVAANREIVMQWNYNFEAAILAAVEHGYPPKPIVKDIDAWINEYERRNKASFGKQKGFGEEQKEAIRLANQMHRVFAISGYAGTGKTTTARAILKLITERLEPDDVACCALAGIAANRIQMQSGFPASTIHTLLGYKGSGWTYNAKNRLPHKLVLLDEASMDDVELLYRVFQAVDLSRTTVILLGDPAQIAPVGLGQPFADMLKYKLIPNVTLTRIYRQSEDAVITSFAAQVRNGQAPDTTRNYEDFSWTDHSLPNYWGIEKAKRPEALMENNLKIQASILDIARGARKDVLQKRKEGDWWGFITRFQVVSPMRMSQVGTMELNGLLQDVFNPGNGVEILRGSDKRSFRPGDKVVHLRNQWMRRIEPYEISAWKRDDLECEIDEDNKVRVMNGQLGIITDVRDGEMVVHFPIEKIHVLYQEQAINSMSVDLGYALTVHKTQGSEYDQVVVPVTSSHLRMLSPQLLYTAMTRAKGKLDMVGQREAFAMGCKARPDQARRTCIASWRRPKEEVEKVRTAARKRFF